MLTTILFCAFAPAVFTAVLLLATGALKSDTHLRWTLPLAIVGGFAIAQYGTDGVPRFPPVEASGWFTPIAVVLGILAVALADTGSAAKRYALRVIVAIAITVTIVYPLLGPTWTPPVAAAWIAGFVVVIVVGWSALSDTAQHAAGPGLPLAILVTAAGTGAVLASSGSARYGQLAGAVASVMGPVVLLGLLRKNSTLLRNCGWVSGVLLAMLLVAGVTFVDVPPAAAFLLGVSPVGYRLGELKALQNRPWWQRELVRVGVAVVLAAVAAVLAMPKSDPYGY